MQWKITRLMALCSALLLFTTGGCRTLPNSGADADLATTEGDHAAPVDGRYLGYGKLNAYNGRVPLELDLVRTGGTATSPSYRAVLRLARGTLSSSEYGAVYFPEVTWSGKNQTLSFAGELGGAGIKLTDAHLRGGTLTAKLSAETDKAGAEVSLLRLASGTKPTAEVNMNEKNTEKIFANQPVLHTVMGHYSGNCAGFSDAIEVETSKWRGAENAAPLFSGYRLSGRMAQLDDTSCGKAQSCLKETYSGGEFNFFTGALSLKSGLLTKQCTLQDLQLTCDKCTLVKDQISPYATLDVPRRYQLYNRGEHLRAESAKAGAKAAPRTPAILGQYYGYLHHEGRNVYQLVALNVKNEDAHLDEAEHAEAAGSAAFAGAPAASPKIAAVATLYFGEGDSSEFIAYKFNDSETPLPGKTLLLDGPGEAFLVVKEWQDKTVRGIWYSKVFGRVGTVELQRDLVPRFAAEVETVERISGLYKGADWDFELAASANLSENPGDFYPLKVYGWAREKIDNARRRSIEEGAFDLYTGTFSFRLDDGRIAMGRLTPSGMQLYWPPKPHLGALMGAGSTQQFQRVNDTPRRQIKAALD